MHRWANLLCRRQGCKQQKHNGKQQWTLVHKTLSCRNCGEAASHSVEQSVKKFWANLDTPL
jgi:hypothetical protein